VFPRPDTFDIRRAPNPQVAFGHGTHVCIAAWLGRVEVQEALRGLFTRLPGLRLAVQADALQWSKPQADVGLAKLLVTW
jgi:cytochrome P450